MSSAEVEVQQGHMFGASESYDEDENEKHSLFLGDLSIYCDEKDIESAFAPYGNIVDVRIQRSKETSRALSYGFIEFSTRESAAAALREMNYFLLKGRPLRIRWAADRKNPIKSTATPHDSAATVYVRFLTQADHVVVSEESLRNLFNTYGPVFDCAIKKLSQEQKGTRVKGYAFVSFDSGALAQGSIDVAGVEAAFRACSDLRNRVIDQVRYRCELGNRLQKQAANVGLGLLPACAMPMPMQMPMQMPMSVPMLPCGPQYVPYSVEYHAPQGPYVPHALPPQGQTAPHLQQGQSPGGPVGPHAHPHHPQPQTQAQSPEMFVPCNTASHSYSPTIMASPYASRDSTPTNHQLRLAQMAAHQQQAQQHAQQVQQGHHGQAHQSQGQGQGHAHHTPPYQAHQQQHHSPQGPPQYVPQMGYTPMTTPTHGHSHLLNTGMVQHPQGQAHGANNSYQAQLAAQAQAQLQAQAIAQAQLNPPQYVQYQYYPSGPSSGCNSGAATPVSVARAALGASQLQHNHNQGQLMMHMPGMMMMPMPLQMTMNMNMQPQHMYPNMQQTGNANHAFTPTSFARHQQQQHQHQQHQALQHHAQQQQGILKELSCSQHFAAKGISLSIKTHSFDEPPSVPQRSYASDVTPRELYLQRKQNPTPRRAQYNNNNNGGYHNPYIGGGGGGNNHGNHNHGNHNHGANHGAAHGHSYSPNLDHKPASRRGSSDSIATTSLFLGTVSREESVEFAACPETDRERAVSEPPASAMPVSA